MSLQRIQSADKARRGRAPHAPCTILGISPLNAMAFKLSTWRRQLGRQQGTCQRIECGEGVCRLGPGVGGDRGDEFRLFLVADRGGHRGSKRPEGNARRQRRGLAKPPVQRTPHPRVALSTPQPRIAGSGLVHERRCKYPVYLPAAAQS